MKDHKFKYVCTNKPGTEGPGNMSYEANYRGYKIIIKENGFCESSTKSVNDVSATYEVYYRGKKIQSSIFGMPTHHIMKEMWKEFPKCDASPEIRSPANYILSNLKKMINNRRGKKSEHDKKLLLEILIDIELLGIKILKLED